MSDEIKNADVPQEESQQDLNGLEENAEKEGILKDFDGKKA